MPKKILFESAVHQITFAAKRFKQNNSFAKSDFDLFIQSWSFQDLGNRKLRLQWTYPTANSIEIDCTPAQLYTRNDLIQQAHSVLEDPTQTANRDFFDNVLKMILNNSSVLKVNLQ